MVEQRTVKCGSVLRSDPLVGSSNLPSRTVVFFLTKFEIFQINAGLKIKLASVHSTRVVFIPSKDKIRVRVPMDALGMGDCCTW